MPLSLTPSLRSDYLLESLVIFDSDRIIRDLRPLLRRYPLQELFPRGNGPFSTSQTARTLKKRSLAYASEEYTGPIRGANNCFQEIGRKLVGPGTGTRLSHLLPICHIVYMGSPPVRW